MNKQPLIIGTIVLLLAVIFSGCLGGNGGLGGEQEEQKVPLSYRVVEAKAYGKLSGLNWITEAYVEIKNTDTIPGTFKVNFHFRTAKSDYYPSEIGYIVPGESKKIYCTVDTAWGEDVTWNYDVKPPYKTMGD